MEKDLTVCLWHHRNDDLRRSSSFYDDHAHYLHDLNKGRSHSIVFLSDLLSLSLLLQIPRFFLPGLSYCQRCTKVNQSKGEFGTFPTR